MASQSIKRIKPGTRMSQAVVSGGIVFVAGQVAQNPGKTVGEQTAQITAQLDELLAAAGSHKTRLLSASIWLTDISTFAEMNAVWDAWVPADKGPARATVEAKLAAPQYRVEIAVTASVGKPVVAAKARPKAKTKAKRR
ncbi:MAG: RidA family protein [Alphaproteobacteria bacterium]|nr:RidA family protein [Alphaproteobacteria bacterium]